MSGSPSRWRTEGRVFVIACSTHFKVVRSVAAMIALLSRGVDKVVILRAPSPPRYEEGEGTGWRQLAMDVCWFCEWERDAGHSIFWYED